MSKEPPEEMNCASNRAPSGPWLRTLFVAFLLLLLSMGAIEALWRSVGIRPSVSDNPDLWANHRHQLVASKDNKPITIVGASRAQLGISPPTMRQLLPGREVVTLAMSGQCGLSTLEALANDPRFAGVVIFSTTAHCFDVGWEGQKEYNRHYQNGWTTDRRLNAWFKAQVQSRLAVTSSHTSLFRLMTRHLRRRTLPPPNYQIGYADRTHAADYSLLDIKKHRAERIAKIEVGTTPPTAPAGWLKRALAIDPWLKAIEDRGGTVVVLRMPTQDEHWQIDEQAYPRASYWDALAEASTSNALFLHFLDIPGAKDFHLPDTSHLDDKDRPAFTRLLLEALAERGAIDPAPTQ